MSKLKMIVTLFVSILLLAACGTGGASLDSESSTSEDDNSTATDIETSVEPVEIEFWYGLGSVAGETMESIISDFNQSQESVIVKGVSQADYTETWQNVQAALAANNAPAVFIGGTSLVNAYGGDEGIFEPLDDYMDAEDFNRADLLSVFTEANIVDGKTYGVAGYGTTQIMYFNANVYQEAGIDPDEAFASWENLAEASEKIQVDTDAEFGHMIMWGYENLRDIALSNGGQVISDDGTEVLINSPEWVDAWEFVRKSIHDDKTMGIISGGQGWEYWYRTIDQVMNDNAGGYVGSSGDRGDLDFTYIDARVQPGMGGNSPAPIANGLNMIIPKAISQAEKDAGFQWIEYFTSPEVQSFWSMTIGYIPVRESTMQVPEYQQHVEENPYAGIPYQQALHASPEFIDPTGGLITDALAIAADKVELENISAQDALNEAAEVAQQALDDHNNQ